MQKNANTTKKNEKLTQEEREQRAIDKAKEKEQRAIERRLRYRDGHFCYSVTEDGITTDIPLNGAYTDKGVVFTFDGNSYVAVVDGGNDTPFTKPYTRCKETSKQYYVKTLLVSKTKACDCELIASACIDENGKNMTYSQIFAKAKRVFKETKSKRAIEAIELCSAKATKVARKKADAEARAEASKAKAEAPKAEEKKAEKKTSKKAEKAVA